MLSRRCFLTAGALPAFAQSRPRVEIRQVTRGPKHHFFGYIGHVGNSPWNTSGRYMVCLESAFQDRMPRPGEPASLCLIDTQGGDRIDPVETCRAWNFQQGSMIYWNPRHQESELLFNDRDPKTHRVFTVLYDVARRKRIREYRFEDTPAGNGGVAQQGGYFLAINYGRMARLRPVTGYPGAFDWAPDNPHPDNDGVFRVEIESGQKRLLVSFRQLAAVIRQTRPDVDSIPLFINHTLANRDNTRVFFFARGNFDDRATRIDVPFVMKPDGSDLRVQRHIGGHPEWETGARMIGQIDGRQVIFDTESQRIVETLGDPEIFPAPGGDIALSPDGGWLVNGYGRQSRNYYVFYRRRDRVWVRTRGFDIKGWESGELRNDPAPCWDRAGRRIAFPAFGGDGTRQVWVASLTGDITTP